MVGGGSGQARNGGIPLGMGVILDYELFKKFISSCTHLFYRKFKVYFHKLFVGLFLFKSPGFAFSFQSLPTQRHII